MNKFKVGDLVIPTNDNPYDVTGKKAKYPFTVIELRTHSWGDIVVELDHREESPSATYHSKDRTYEVDSQYFQLAQPYLNELKLKKVLGL